MGINMKNYDYYIFWSVVMPVGCMIVGLLIGYAIGNAENDVIHLTPEYATRGWVEYMVDRPITELKKQEEAILDLAERQLFGEKKQGCELQFVEAEIEVDCMEENVLKYLKDGVCVTQKNVWQRTCELGTVEIIE